MGKTTSYPTHVKMRSMFPNVMATNAYHCKRNYYPQAFSVFGILPEIQAPAEIPAGTDFACNSRGSFALQHVKRCVVT